MSARLSGTVKSTPRVPPKPAIISVCTKSKWVQRCSMMSAGMVKITPAASASPALAMVCTMLFSRMFERLKKRSTPMEITAAGMDAETVMPANRPRYAFAPARIAASRMPRIVPLIVISGRL